MIPGRLHYRHQLGRCDRPDRPCPGHTGRQTARTLRRIDALRDAGRLAYLGPDLRPWWMRLLRRR